MTSLSKEINFAMFHMEKEIIIKIKIFRRNFFCLINSLRRDDGDGGCADGRALVHREEKVKLGILARKGGDGRAGGCATQPLGVEQSHLIGVGNGGGHKENGDIEPIGGLANHAVVGVKNHGDEHKPQQDTA